MLVGAAITIRVAVPGCSLIGVINPATGPLPGGINHGSTGDLLGGKQCQCCLTNYSSPFNFILVKTGKLLIHEIFNSRGYRKMSYANYVRAKFQ